METLAACAAAVDTQLATFVESQPGVDLPRDIAHLRGQAAIIRFAARGGWRARVEEPIDPRSPRSRSIDVYLEREERRELAIVELVDLLADGGEAMRGLADKVAAVRRVNAAIRVLGLLVVRATRRNRAIVAELADLLAARFPARSSAWISALVDVTRPMPTNDGLAWARVDGSSIFAVRRRH